MKKITIILAIVATILLIGEGLYFFNALSKPKTVAITPPQVEKKAQIVLFKERGDVYYKSPGDADFKMLIAASLEIPNLTSVKTVVGRGSVLLPDNSVISLSDNTEISVNYTEQSTSIFQSLGNTYHRVEKLITGKTYEVQTPGTLAAVRGTKFAVSYDKLKATTKVAVTEHSVSVARIQKSFEPNATSTAEVKLEEVQVTEGNSAKIIEATSTATTTAPGTKPSTGDKTPRLSVSKIDDDADLKVWIDENKVRDPVIEKIKVDVPDKKVYRQQLETLLKSDPAASVPTPTDTTKPQTQTTPTTTKQVATTIPIKPVATTTPPLVIKKISEEEFYDKFNTLFIKYFYIENDDSICAFTSSTDARVKETSDLATMSGYPLPAGSVDSLKKFSDDIISYCKTAKGDTKARSALQSRFDEEFPFKNSI